MKHLSKILFVVLLALAVSACSKFNDSEIWKAINEHSEEIASLKNKCNSLNSDIASLKEIVASIQSGDYITNCTPLSDGSGYTIAFKSGKSIVIKNGVDGRDGADGKDGSDGKDGKDGATPQIGIDKYTDGLYYWTLNGKWLLDKNGNMIKAEGKDGADGHDGQDGITPKLKIEDGNWYISLDNGVTWTYLGKATGADGKDGKDGESLFKSVTPGEDCIIFVLSNGTELRVPYYVPEKKNPAVTGDYSDLTENSVVLYGWCNQEELDGYPVEYGIEYSATDLTTAATTIRASSKDSENKFSCSLNNLSSSTIYYYRTFVLFYGVRIYGEVKTFTTDKFPELVDLGLSVKWGTCNIGAIKPEEYGDYFAWGEIDTYYNGNPMKPSGWKTGKSDGYTWSSYKWCSGSGNSLSKYNDNPSYGVVDYKRTLDMDDDVAHVNLGGKWRIPTKTEYEELLGNCIIEEITYHGVDGLKLTSKKAGYEGNWIFMPSSGYIFETSKNVDLGAGKHGYYWTSSIKQSDSAYKFSFNTRYNIGIEREIGSAERYLGLPVRPVSE